MTHALHDLAQRLESKAARYDRSAKQARAVKDNWTATIQEAFATAYREAVQGIREALGPIHETNGEKVAGKVSDPGRGV